MTRSSIIQTDHVLEYIDTNTIDNKTVPFYTMDSILLLSISIIAKFTEILSYL